MEKREFESEAHMFDKSGGASMVKNKNFTMTFKKYKFIINLS